MQNEVDAVMPTNAQTGRDMRRQAQQQYAQHTQQQINPNMYIQGKYMIDNAYNAPARYARYNNQGVDKNQLKMSMLHWGQRDLRNKAGRNQRTNFLTGIGKKNGFSKR